MDQLPPLMPERLQTRADPRTPTNHWFDNAARRRLAEPYRGKHVDAVIGDLGPDYLITLAYGRHQPRLYYRLAGTRSWASAFSCWTKLCV